jgi:outer membrane protein assembly factor BamA
MLVLVLALLASSAHADEVVPDDDFGPTLFIEEVHIHGNTATQDEIIRRALPIAPGDILRATDKRLAGARFKVLALGYFRDVTIAMRRGSQHGNVIIEITVVERGTFVLDRLWFGHTALTPYWLGVDVGERNLFGLGIAMGGAFIYAADGGVDGGQDQWAGELRLSDGSLRGTRWGARGSLTLVHGSEIFRIKGSDDDTGLGNFNAFTYRRFGGRFGATYDLTALTRLSIDGRLETIDASVPAAPTRTLPDGRVAGVELHLEPGESRVVTAGLGLDRDTRSDPILPHAGGRLTASVELGTSALGSSYDFATIVARYEHWWPFRDDRHALGLRVGGGVVTGNAPHFDRIYIADLDPMLTPRPLGLVLSNATPLDFFSTRDEKPPYGEIGGIATVEYAAELFRGAGKNRVYGGDLFVGAGVYGLAETNDYLLRDAGFWHSLPADLYVDTGLRIDTDVGVFELTLSNALGRVR